MDVLCAALYLRPDEVNPELTFSDMGLDSIGAVEVARELNRAYGLDIDSVAVYDYPTVPQLAGYVLDRAASQDELIAQAVRPAAPTAPASSRTAPALTPEPAAPPDPARAGPSAAAEPRRAPRLTLRRPPSVRLRGATVRQGSPAPAAGARVPRKRTQPVPAGAQLSPSR